MTVSSHTLTAQHAIKISFTLSKPGTVRLRLFETVHGKAKLVGTVTIKERKAGRHTYKLTERFAGHKLNKGNYTLSLQTIIGKHRSKAVTRKLTVL